MEKVTGKFCQPSGDIRVRTFDVAAYKKMSEKEGRTMTAIMRKAAKNIADRYPEQVHSEAHLSVDDMPIRGLGKSGEKIKQICSQLGVSVSDFMKIELYNELVLKKKIA